MKSLKGYLAARAKEKLAVTERAVEALDALAAAGGQIDRLLLAGERAKATATRQEAAALEATVQCLGGMSRECWKAHAAALTVTQAVQQLEETESRLAEAAR